MNYKFVVYFFYMVMIIGAAYIIYAQPFDNGRRRIQRLILTEKIKKGANRFTAGLKEERLEVSLRNAGYPLGLNCLSFQIIRLSMLVVWLVSIFSGWLFSSNPFPMNSFAFACLFFVFTIPVRNTPFSMLLDKLAQSHLREKNKEVFTLYSMIDNEFISSNGSPLTMYSLLNKLQPNFSSIKPAIGKAILLWRNDPSLALDAFANEVGTAEAKDLANILKNVDATGPAEALDILQNRREQFLTMRHEIYRRYQKNRGVRDYAITFGASLLVMFNMLVLFYQEYKEMMRFLNQH
ncbi:MAG: hypothetical protein M0021_17100 [Clostridia bacterium]|nr:hypothetical protein [Clostridia bacterium]